METILETKKQKKGADQDEIPRMIKFLALMESLVRGFDQLDEQLHAGDYFYVLTNLSRFVNNSAFLWPAALLLLSYWFSHLLDFMDHTAEQSDHSSGAEALFVILTHSLSFVFIFVPQIVSNDADFHQISDNALTQCTNKTLITLAVTSFVFILCYNLKYYGQLDHTVLKVCHWFTISVLLAGLVVYVYPVFILTEVFLWTLVNNCVSLFGLKRSKSAKDWIVSHLLFLAWLAFGLAVLLGTILFSNQ